MKSNYLGLLLNSSYCLNTFNKSSAVAETGDRLATVDMGRKVWSCCASFWGIGEGQKPKQLQCTSTEVEWPVMVSLIITLEGKR